MATNSVITLPRCVWHTARLVGSLWCNVFAAYSWLKEMPLTHSKQWVEDEVDPSIKWAVNQLHQLPLDSAWICLFCPSKHLLGNDNKLSVQDPLVHLKYSCTAESTSYSPAISNHKETFLVESLSKGKCSIIIFGNIRPGNVNEACSCTSWSTSPSLAELCLSMCLCVYWL